MLRERSISKATSPPLSDEMDGDVSFAPATQNQSELAKTTIDIFLYSLWAVCFSVKEFIIVGNTAHFVYTLY